MMFTTATMDPGKILFGCVVFTYTFSFLGLREDSGEFTEIRRIRVQEFVQE
jgi:hypothetical protein